MEVGKAFGIQPAGHKALDSPRLKEGYRLWGSDVTPEDNPYEARFASCMGLKTGGDFIRREPLLKVTEEGIRKKRYPPTLGGTPV